MVNNVVVFQGVEVTLPTEASFSHRDGVLEVDMSHGFHGRLLLRQGKAPPSSSDCGLFSLRAALRLVRSCMALYEILEQPRQHHNIRIARRLGPEDQSI